MADSLPSVSREVALFRQLYWGPLAIVEDQQVLDAMVDFADRLKDVQEGSTITELRPLSYFLARACRRSLRDTWEPVPLDDIEDGKMLK